MKCRRASCAYALFLALATPAWSSALTLQECLQRAQDNSPVLKSSAWDTRIARENVRQASAAFLPRLDAQAGYTMQLEPQAVIISGRTAETQEADFGFAGLSASYTIYDFGRRTARRQQAEALVDASSQSFESLRSDTALQVIAAYFGILESNRLIQAAGEEVTQVEQHRRVAQVLFEEGVVTRNDVLQADVRLAGAHQKLMSLKNRRENIWLLLNFLTGNRPDQRTELDESSVMTSAPGQDLNGTSDLTGRHDIQALQHRVSASEYEIAENRGNFFPELYTRLGFDYVQNDKVREQAIMSATVGIKINLFDGYASSATRDRAIVSRSRNLDTLRLAQQQARLEIDTARNDVAVAKERIGVAETAIRQGDENLRINRERYRERVGTATEVLDAQTLLTQAKTDYYRAFYDHQTATARLLKSLGHL